MGPAFHRLEMHSWRSLPYSDGHLDRPLRGSRVQIYVRRVARHSWSEWWGVVSLKKRELPVFRLHVKNVEVIIPTLALEKVS